MAKISEEIAQIFNALCSPGQSISNQLSIRTVIFNPGRYKKKRNFKGEGNLELGITKTLINTDRIF